jgi:adenylate kinase family enzyme
MKEECNNPHRNNRQLSLECLEPMRVPVTGASGSGTTTLGRALSVRLGSSFLDADDYYWMPTNPPYEEKRAPAARLQLILADLRKTSSAVVAGCVRTWGRELEDSFSLIVFLILDAEIRVARLREREMSERGRVDEVFLEWAAQYETGRMSGRSRALHEKWLSERSCPTLRLEGDLSVAERVARVTEALSNQPLPESGLRNAPRGR